MKKSTKLLLLVAILVALAGLWSWLPLTQWIDQLRTWVLSLGILGIVLFVASYVVLTIVLAPVSVLTMTAGLAYGFWGIPLVVVSATLAATCAFLLGRYVARDRVEKWINQDPRLRSLNTVIRDEDWRIVGLMRLSPLIPFGLQNYLFSMSGVRLVPFALATAIGIVPGSALYVYIGILGQTMGDEAGSMKWLFLGVGLITTVFVAWYVGRRASRVLAASNAKQ